MGQRRLGILIIAIVFCGGWAAEAATLDRCVSYGKDVRAAHSRYFGPAFPYWYALGQLRQESNCRDITTAFDGGQGPAQFMPKTAKEIQRLMGETLNPYNRQDAVRMQAFYMSKIHSRGLTGRLWTDYQEYNGGRNALAAELKRAGVADWDLMKLSCQRKKIPLKRGFLDLCEVNYDYSKRIAKYGNQYRQGPDAMRYW
jgi:hypothetical protein